MQEYTITALEPQKNSKRRYNLYLDGEYKCGITEDSVAVFRLKAGQTLTESKLREIMDTTETQIAFDKCLNLRFAATVDVHSISADKMCKRTRELCGTFGIYTSVCRFAIFS